MDEAQEQTRAAWQRFDHEWRQARTVWHDTTTDYFEANFVEPLAVEYQDYVRVLADMLETLRQARSIAQQ